MKFGYFAVPAAFALSWVSSAAVAELPGPVRDMIEAAMATGDPKKVDIVLDLARTTNPGERAEIEVMEEDYRVERTLLAALEAKKDELAFREDSMFRHWSGRGELGGFRATGNSSNSGVTARLDLEREGIDWRHKIRGSVDYQRSNGRTSREQYRIGYEPSYTLSDKVFVYGLTLYERDRFQGYNARYSVSGGVGSRLIERDDLKLSVKGGPAWRQTHFIDDTQQSNFAVLGAMDLDYRIATDLSLTQDANIYFESSNSTLTSATGLEAGLGGDLKARLSYTIEHDTDPPDRSVKTDTLSRFTLVYGF